MKLNRKSLETVWFVVFLLAWVAVSVIVSQLVVGFIMVSMLGAERLVQPVWSAAYSLISYALALTSVILVPPQLAKTWKIRGKTKREQKEKPLNIVDLKTSREEMGLSAWPTWTDIGLAPVAYVVGTLLAALLILIFSIFPWFDAEEAQEVGFSVYVSGVDRLIAFMILVVLAPIVEELVFRGWLYGKLRSRLSAPLSILLVSALFGLMHMQWNVGVNVFALSVVLCVLREITGTVYAGILTHMIKNGVAFYMLYIMGI